VRRGLPVAAASTGSVWLYLVAPYSMESFPPSPLPLPCCVCTHHPSGAGLASAATTTRDPSAPFTQVSQRQGLGFVAYTEPSRYQHSHLHLANTFRISGPVYQGPYIHLAANGQLVALVLYLELVVMSAHTMSVKPGPDNPPPPLPLPPSTTTPSA